MSSWVGEQRFVDGKGRFLPAHITLTPMLDNQTDKKEDSSAAAAAAASVRSVTKFMLILTPRGPAV